MSYSPSDGPPKTAKEKKIYNAHVRHNKAGIDALNELMGGSVEKIEKSQSDKDGELMGYLRANIAKPAFAVARRQGFKRVLGIVSDLTWDVAKIKQQAAELIRERDGYKALATAIYGSATGRFTAEQINGHALLSDKQKKDCLDLIAQHRIAVQVRAEEPPAYDEPFFDQIAMELGEEAQRDLTANSDIHDNNRIG